MRSKLTFAALAVAAGFAASPVLAQSTSQPEAQQPGMGSMAMPGQQAQQQQGSGGCPCCQKMAMHAPQQGQPAPAPR
jgi:hypothetical protein